ncbi:AAA-like domain-containing protein [Crocosphaera chwakensis]|uniref:WD-40 repeat n=1 Tax=Crocosphaera chwakensis CCY0110 TaxID=391612 RepID=A3IW57_9CHRO|nr:AAA-like domain-containing protein [Crocosphaera chwakensis]EAZ89292.1 WD-40 repeat [Crocosphaera chwakensis CCY0110]
MNDFYHVGGSVPLDSPSYIKREADNTLYSTLKNGQLCYVLNSRQMGKSSLWVHTQNKLKEEGIQCATISFNGLGNDLSEDNWYTIIFNELVKAFDLSTDAKAEAQILWDKSLDTSPLYSLTQFIEKILLKEVKQSIVICFDEIDSVISLNFSSDPFFSFIRSCYEKRYIKPIYQRLTFCILGVATTADFIPNNARSPFDIGKDIALEGFNKGEVRQLVQGLKDKVEDTERILDHILEWTGGQPFLTQKICQLICDSRTYFSSQLVNNTVNIDNTINIDNFIKSQIVNNWESNDSPQHLRTIRDRLLNNSPTTKRRLLELYQEILANGDVEYNGSPEQIKLRLTGLVVQTEGKLKVYNKIYRNIFDEQWTENELNEIHEIPPYIEQSESWLQSGRQSEHLLSGEQLHEAIKWGKDKTLKEQEKEFLRLSQLEQEKQQNIVRQQEASRQSEKILSSAFEKDQQQLLITEILNWTGNQPELTRIISNLVVKNKYTLEKSKEKGFVEQIIQKNIIENWQSNQASEHLTEIKETILETDGNIKERLKIYKDVLQTRVLTDNTPEKIALFQSQLVIKKDDYLEVANPIYKAVFNIQWVNQQLEELTNIDSNPEPVTVKSSLIMVIVFVLVTIFFIGSKIKNSDSPLPENIPVPENIPEICVEPIDGTPLDSQLKSLKDLEEQLGNTFPSKCQEKIAQLQQEKLNQQVRLNREFYNKALKEGADNRVKDGVIYLCQIKEIPNDIEYARDKLEEWFDNSYWRDDVIESFSQINNCPATGGTDLEQYLRESKNE